MPRELAREDLSLLARYLVGWHRRKGGAARLATERASSGTESKEKRQIR